MTRFRVDDDFFAYHITTKILHKIPLAEDRPLQYIFETVSFFFRPKFTTVSTEIHYLDKCLKKQSYTANVVHCK